MLAGEIAAHALCGAFHERVAPRLMPIDLHIRPLAGSAVRPPQRNCV